MSERSMVMWGLAPVVALLVGLTGCASTPPATPAATPSTDTPTPSAHAAPTGDVGWIAFTADWDAGDVLFVRPGEPAHPIVGKDDDGVVRVCPAFAPGGTRLAFGEAAGDWNSGWSEAKLVFADVTPDGGATIVDDVALETLTSAPCPIWSPDGRWIAFGAQTAGGDTRLGSPEVWLFDTETGDITTIDDLMITDIEWAPDSSAVYLADAQGVLVYSMADGERRLLDDTAVAQNLTVSPDGTALALERRRINAAERFDLVLMDVDGTDQQVVAGDYSQMHGLGPVWSPDGTRIVYQRTCETVPDGSGGERMCSEEHDVVVVTVADHAQTVLPRAQTSDDAHGVVTWYPYSVTWSPDSAWLLYLGWAIPDDIDTDFVWRDGPVIVSPDGAGPPTILSEDEGLHVYTSRPMNVFQSWSAPAG